MKRLVVTLVLLTIGTTAKVDAQQDAIQIGGAWLRLGSEKSEVLADLSKSGYTPKKIARTDARDMWRACSSPGTAIKCEGSGPLEFVADELVYVSTGGHSYQKTEANFVADLFGLLSKVSQEAGRDPTVRLDLQADTLWTTKNIRFEFGSRAVKVTHFERLPRGRRELADLGVSSRELENWVLVSEILE